MTLTLPYDDQDAPSGAYPAELDLPIYLEEDETTEPCPMTEAQLDALDEMLTPICTASVDLALSIADSAARIGDWESSAAWLMYADRQSRWERRR